MRIPRLSKILFFFFFILILVNCNTAQHTIIKTRTISKSNISLEIKPVDLTRSNIEMNRGDMKGIAGGVIELVFSPGKYKQDDANALTETIKKTIEENKLFDGNSKDKYTMDINIVYYTMHIGSFIPNSKFLSFVECKIYDSKNNVKDQFTFSMLFKRIFYLTIGGLKSDVNEAIAYKIINETVNKLANKSNAVNEYGDAVFYATFAEAQKAF